MNVFERYLYQRLHNPVLFGITDNPDWDLQAFSTAVRWTFTVSGVTPQPGTHFTSYVILIGPHASKVPLFTPSEEIMTRFDQGANSPSMVILYFDSTIHHLVALVYYSEPICRAATSPFSPEEKTPVYLFMVFSWGINTFEQVKHSVHLCREWDLAHLSDT